jgi:hypothetical protein
MLQSSGVSEAAAADSAVRITRYKKTMVFFNEHHDNAEEINADIICQ